MTSPCAVALCFGEAMGKPKRQIKVYLTGAFAMTQRVHFFSDWFSFADWLKQEALAGRCAIIYNWEYVDGTDWQQEGG